MDESRHYSTIQHRSVYIHTLRYQCQYHASTVIVLARFEAIVFFFYLREKREGGEIQLGSTEGLLDQACLPTTHCISAHRYVY